MRLGLISDTHIPDRCRTLPSTLKRIFQGVEMIVHAGDIGPMSVLTELEHIAPVLAVYGNDEPANTIESLPYSRVLNWEGHRVLVTHGHDRDWSRESRLRKLDSWTEKLDYWAARAIDEQADVLIYGHTHVPTAVMRGGILLVNPGSLGSGSFFHRLRCGTVAVMTVKEGESIAIEHFDVDDPDHPVTLSIEWALPFSRAMSQFHELMYDESVAAQSGWVRERLYPVAPDQVVFALESLASECWFGQREFVTREAFLERLLSNPATRTALEGRLTENEVLGDAC